jgi:glutathione S-transferase
MMYKLYNVKRWGSMAVHLVLEELDVPYENVWMTPEQVRVPEFKDISPLGYIPALGLVGGETLFESAAIVSHLVVAHPDRGLSPRPGTVEFGEFLSWLHFMSTNIYPTIDLAAGYQEHLAADAAHAQHLVSAGLAKLAALFGVVEQRLSEEGPFLMGSGYSALDPYLLMLTVWGKPTERSLHERFPHISRQSNAVRQRPRLKAALEAHDALQVPA